MKNSQQLIATLLLMLLGVQFGHAQEGRVYVSNNPGGPGLSVRWVGKEISYPEGVKIYRKAGRKDWELLTGSPVMPPSSLDPGFNLTDNQKGIFEAFLKMDHQEFVDGFSGIFTLIESIKSFPLALAMHIAYNDETAEKGKKYSYKVEAIDKGKTILLGITEEIKCAEFSPRPAPANITVDRKRKRTHLWWENDQEQFYAYNVYLRGPEDSTFKVAFNEIGSGNIGDAKKNFLDLRTHKDSLYVIKVQGLDYFGQLSEMSAEVEIAVKDMDAPVPVELTVKTDSKKGEVRISWTKGPEPDLAHYNMFRIHEEVDTVYQQINRKPINADDTLFTDRPGVGAFSYRLESVDEVGNAAKSLPYTAEVADIAPPPVPQYFDIKADTGLFVLRWQPVKAADLKGYIVLRSVADEDNSDNVYMPASQIIDTNYFAEPIAKNVRAPFVYVVQSVDSLFNKSQLSEAKVAQLPDVTPPVAPFIRSVSEVDQQLRIEWVENVEKDLKGYHIYRRTKGDTVDFTRLNGLMVPRSISAYTDKDVVRGQFYEYYVEAIDFSDLKSPISNVASGKLEFLPLEGEVSITRQKFNAVRKEVNLAWNTSNLVNEPLIGSAIFRSYAGGKALQRGKVSDKGQFKEKITKPGVYQYHVRVYGSRGNIIQSELIEIEVTKE